jgi:hypothetical protein
MPGRPPDGPLLALWAPPHLCNLLCSAWGGMQWTRQRRARGGVRRAGFSFVSGRSARTTGTKSAIAEASHET